jgi:hypothetical protein
MLPDATFNTLCFLDNFRSNCTDPLRGRVGRGRVEQSNYIVYRLGEIYGEGQGETPQG